MSTNHTPQTLLAPQTAALTVGNEVAFLVTASLHGARAVTIMAPGLAGVEEVDVFFSVDGGVTWAILYDDSDTAVVLTATKTVKGIFSPMLLGFLKDTTVAAVGIYVEKGLT